MFNVDTSSLLPLHFIKHSVLSLCVCLWPVHTRQLFTYCFHIFCCLSNTLFGTCPLVTPGISYIYVTETVPSDMRMFWEKLSKLWLVSLVCELSVGPVTACCTGTDIEQRLTFSTREVTFTTFIYSDLKWSEIMLNWLVSWFIDDHLLFI